MKQIVLLVCILISSLTLAQEQVFFYSYRNVPADEMEMFKKNEAEFWSKVHSNLVKKKKITGWAMLSRVGGLASEPNIYFFLGVGSYENLDNMQNSYQEAYAEVMSSMDANAQSKMKERLNQEKFEYGTAMLNRRSAVWADDADWNYLVHNYAKANDVGGFLDAQEKYLKPFFEEHIKAKNTKQVGWMTASMLNPRGHAYKWNCYTADAYKTIGDIYNAWNIEDVTYPEEGMTEINKTTEKAGFWKSVIWKKEMWLDEEGDFHSIDD